MSRKELGDLLLIAGRTDEADEALVRSRTALEALLAERPARADLRLDLAEVIEALARLRGTTGRAEDALGLFHRAEALFQAAVDHDPGDLRGRIGLAGTLRGLGLNASLQGRYAEARAALERAVVHRRAALGLRPGDEATRVALADDQAVLGEVLDFMGQPRPSEDALKEAATLHGELAREFPNVPDYAAKAAGDEVMMGAMYGEIRRYPDAEAAYRRGLAGYADLRRRFPDRVDYRLREAGARGNLARMLGELERFRDAEAEARAAIDLYEHILKDSPAQNRARTGLATCLHTLGNGLGDVNLADSSRRPPGPERLAEARRCLERAIDLSRTALETDPGDILGRSTLRGAHHSLAHVLTLSGRYDEARRCCLAVTGLYEGPKLGALKGLELANDCLRLVKRAGGRDARRPDEIAEGFIAMGRDLRRRALAPDSPDFGVLAELAGQLGFLLEPELRDTDAALRLARSLVEKEPGSGLAWQVLGASYYGAGEWRAAREALEKSQAILPDDVETPFVLAMALWKCGDREGARRCYQRAVSRTDHRSRRVHFVAAAVLGLDEAPLASKGVR